jgi:hypothetical protein
MSARCTLALPRGFGGNRPALALDLVFEDRGVGVPEAGGPLGRQSRFSELVGAPYRPSLGELVAIMDALAETLTHVAPIVLRPLLRKGRREQLLEWLHLTGEPLPLVGPNFHVQSQPRGLPESLSLPAFPRFEGGFDRNDLMLQTPARVSAYDSTERLALIRGSLREFLRAQEYRDFEDLVDQLGGVVEPPRGAGGLRTLAVGNAETR